jgi:hypothetical protein
MPSIAVTICSALAVQTGQSIYCSIGCNLEGRHGVARAGGGRRGRLTTDRCCRRFADERQSRWQSTARFLLSVGLSTCSTKKFVNSATLRGRLPNERKILVFPWTIRENGVMANVDVASLFGVISDEGIRVAVATKTSPQYGVAPSTPIARQQSARLHRTYACARPWVFLQMLPTFLGYQHRRALTFSLFARTY